MIPRFALQTKCTFDSPAVERARKIRSFLYFPFNSLSFPPLFVILPPLPPFISFSPHSLFLLMGFRVWKGNSRSIESESRFLESRQPKTAFQPLTDSRRLCLFPAQGICFLAAWGGGGLAAGLRRDKGFILSLNSFLVVGFRWWWDGQSWIGGFNVGLYGRLLRKTRL